MGLYSKSVIKRLATQKGVSSEQVVADTKGKFGGNCNRSACLAPGATFFNKSTRAFYCARCAELINQANRGDSERLYGTPLLCEEIEGDHAHEIYMPDGSHVFPKTKAEALRYKLVASAQMIGAKRTSATPKVEEVDRGHYIGLDRK